MYKQRNYFSNVYSQQLGAWVRESLVSETSLQTVKTKATTVTENWNRNTLKTISVNLLPRSLRGMHSCLRNLFLLPSYSAIKDWKTCREKCKLQIITSCQPLEAGPKAMLQPYPLIWAMSPHDTPRLLSPLVRKFASSPEDSLAPRPLLKFPGPGI